MFWWTLKKGSIYLHVSCTSGFFSNNLYGYHAEVSHSSDAIFFMIDLSPNLKKAKFSNPYFDAHHLADDYIEGLSVFQIRDNYVEKNLLNYYKSNRLKGRRWYLLIKLKTTSAFSVKAQNKYGIIFTINEPVDVNSLLQGAL